MSSLEPILQKIPKGSATRVFEWAMSGQGGVWFQRNDIELPKFKAGTLSSSLQVLVDLGLLEKKGEKRGSWYRIRTGVLEDVFKGLA
jgi:hypothetical protein